MKKNDTKDYADLLRQLETKRLTKGTKSVKILVMLKMGNGEGGDGLRWGVCERKGKEREVIGERMGLKDKQGKREWRMKKGELENNKEKKEWEIEVDM